MVSRADVTRLRDATAGVVVLARRDLNKFWQQYRGLGPERFRDALLDFVPALVQRYGDLAATVAAEWYETTRAAALGGTYNALAEPPVVTDQVQGAVRYAAGALFTDNPEVGLSVLNGAVQRLVQYSNRATVRRNADRDVAHPRFARVPTGAKTCAFCLILSSRGFVYHSSKLAGGDEHFHDDCDCQIVADFDKDQAHIEGYDPDRYYQMYQAARSDGGPSLSDAAASVRRLFPDLVSDAVH